MHPIVVDWFAINKLESRALEEKECVSTPFGAGLALVRITLHCILKSVLSRRELVMHVLNYHTCVQRSGNDQPNTEIPAGANLPELGGDCR